MHKKAAFNLGRKTLYFIITIFVITFIFLYMRNAITSYNDDVVSDFSNIEGAVIATEALMSPKCFAYYDEEIDRVYPGIIDYSKLNEETLGKGCMIYIDSPYKIKVLDKILRLTEGEDLETIISPILILKDGVLKSDKMEINVQDYYGWKGQKKPRDGEYYSVA